MLRNIWNGPVNTWVHQKKINGLRMQNLIYLQEVTLNAIMSGCFKLNKCNCEWLLQVKQNLSFFVPLFFLECHQC